MHQSLDPAVRHVISELDALGEPGAEGLNDLTPEQARSWFAVLRAILGGDRTAPEVASVRDEQVLDGARAVPIRIYDTEESIMMPDRVVLYVHGGGWVVGDLDSADFLARSAAHAASRAGGLRRLPARTGERLSGRVRRLRRRARRTGEEAS